MEKIRITDSMEITKVMIGVERLGLEKTQKECFAFIDRYLDAGGNCIDTARLYNAGETDRVLGEWFRQSGKRDKVILCTKGSHNDPSGRSRLSKEEIVGDMDAALRDLRLEYSDIHLLHRDDVSLPVSEIMPVLDSLVKSGKTRAVGVSNWTASRIVEANRFARENGLSPLVASQINYSLAVTTPAATGDLTHITMNSVEYGWYRETQFPVMAYSSKARGYFIKMAAGEPITRPGVLRYYDNFPENHRRFERICRLSKELGVSVSALCVAYVLCDGLNCAALLTISKLSQMEDCFAGHDLHLTPEQLNYLNNG